jgi:hypothetical protein
MIILEAKYSELCLWDTKKIFHVFPIPYDKEFGELIIEGTKDFWFNRVLPAKELYELYLKETDENTKGDIFHKINQLCPPPDDSPAYELFLKEKYKDSYLENVIEGTEEDWANAVNYNKIKDEIKSLEAQQQLYKNKLLFALGEYSKITFGEAGYVSNEKDKNGRKTFRVKIV